MSTACHAPLPLEELIAYHLRELSDQDETRLEEHYFGCPSCARRLESVRRLGDGIVETVRRGMVSASVTADFIARRGATGLRIRSYRVAPGEEVACTAAPEDDFVAVRLHLADERAHAIDIAVEWTALETGVTETRLIPEVTLDRRVGEVVLLFSGSQIRQAPRSRWRMEAVVRDPAGERRVGSYVLDHTPWEQLGERR